MTNEWMIDVLTDLRSFAEKQAMLDLAEHLDDAILVAAMELRGRETGRSVLEPHEQQGRDIFGALTDHGLPG